MKISPKIVEISPSVKINTCENFSEKINLFKVHVSYSTKMISH